jgi:hypothetical protein
MTYLDSIAVATQRALDLNDLPEDLLPLVIVSEAAQLSADEAESMGYAAWH